MYVKLWSVLSGWTGHSYERLLVAACDERQATELAQRRLRAATEVKDTLAALYPPGYVEDLTLELLCDDLSQPWCG